VSKEDFFNRYRFKKDKYGFDLKSCEDAERAFRFLYKNWFRVTLIGVENIPADGRCILYGNHSGVLPIDAFMLYDGIIQKHSAPRRVRFLVNEFVRQSPVMGNVIRGFGGVPAKYDVAKELLDEEELVFFYPEAEKGTGKLYKDRYRLVEFNPGFVKAAVETDSPLVPVVTVGGDEIYPLLANFKPAADAIGAPYWPITPLFPWFPFPVSALPVPVRLLICVGKPFYLDRSSDQANDHLIIEKEANRLRQGIQSNLDDLLEIRRSPFKKWDVERVQDYVEHHM